MDEIRQAMAELDKAIARFWIDCTNDEPYCESCWRDIRVARWRLCELLDIVPLTDEMWRHGEGQPAPHVSTDYMMTHVIKQD